MEIATPHPTHSDSTTLSELWGSGGREISRFLAVLGGLLAILYAPVCLRLFETWAQNPDYSHGFLVPVFSGYVIWKERERFRQLALAPNNAGTLVMLGAIGLLVAGTLGAELFTSRISLILMLAGLVLFLAGWTMLRALAFPLGYLLLMIPIPTLIQNQLVLPLQFVASRTAASVLEALGFVVLREGNLLHLERTTLEVAQACSGIRSLTSMVALAIAYGNLAERRLWVRFVLVALMLPISVASNAVRVVAAGVLADTVGPESVEGIFHTLSGLLIFAVALSLMLAAHWLLARIGKGGRSRE
jgi:exosortase